MIIVRIPKQYSGKTLESFITNVMRKVKRNAEHKQIRLRADVAYSPGYAYLIFEDYVLELAFAISILLKCRERSVPCELRTAKKIDLGKVPREIIEAAEAWSRRKLPRKYYRLRDLPLL